VERSDTHRVTMRRHDHYRRNLLAGAFFFTVNLAQLVGWVEPFAKPNIFELRKITVTVHSAIARVRLSDPDGLGPRSPGLRGRARQARDAANCGPLCADATIDYGHRQPPHQA
jgi:hypothetical protein